MNNMMG